MTADTPGAPGRYDPAEAEPRWMAAWLESGITQADPEREAPPFAIAIPPPNVTGALHMGHALNNTTQDVLVRWRRMAGDATMWICGTDHAGIATQAVVEKALAAEGTSRQELGRAAFEERVWAWRERYGGQIIGQLQRLGCTLDYSRERFTMDEGYQRAVLHVFCDLYEKGYVYRDRYMVNWDPGLGSAISDLEVEAREVTDALYSIAYPLSDGDGELVVSTVRPETMLGDTAVAVNPEDERYRRLVGRRVTLPLLGRELPIVADEYVRPEFGSGALKVTPAHDPNDFEIARRHDLGVIGVIGEDGRMTEAAGPRYAGLTTEAAAERVLADLRDQGLLRGQEPYTHEVPFSHRSGRRVEPLISLQWFCDMQSLAEPAIAAVRDGRVRFHPEHPYTKVYFDWMEGIRPWCISRQLWWGHRLPVWYRGEETHVGLEPPVGAGWQQDPDVLDTWFSSALWPFATLGWPERTPELRAFYPTQVLSTARDIIFLWVARMVMMGLEYMDDVPFSDVIIHSVIQAPDGRRMSKSLGTGIDPLDVIAAHGADALRFGLLLMSSAQDVRFNEERIRQGRQLVTKLWNAAALVRMRGGRAGLPAPAPRTLADRWMSARVGRAIGEADRLLAAFEFSKLADLLYHLVFDDYCDWYLELVKIDEASPETAGHLLEQLLALVHPVMPFVTEEIWSRTPGANGLLATRTWPVAGADADPEAEDALDGLIEFVTALRSYKSERGLTRRDEVVVALELDGATLLPGPIAALAGARLVDEPPAGATALGVSRGRLLVAQPEASVDREAERRRLSAALEAAERELARAERQLANPRFVERAPAELVEAEREKARRYGAERDDLRARLAEAER